MSSARLLVVEDDADLAENLQEILIDLGFAVDVAPTAERALELVTDVAYRGVVTDFRLPGLNGIELIQELRKRGIPSPVVVVSAFMDFRMAEGAARAGALHVVAKPVDIEKLVALIGEFTRLGGGGLKAVEPK